MTPQETTRKMLGLAGADKFHYEAAEGWLGLGNWREADAELDCLAPALRARPDVLRLRWIVCEMACRWELGLEVARALACQRPDSSFGFVSWAKALDQLNRTDEAYNLLIDARPKFEKEYLLRYHLACYTCKLGKLKEAMEYLEEAIDLADQHDIRAKALDDPMLERLWMQIGDI